MTPHKWLTLILDVVTMYQQGQRRPLEQLALRLSQLDEGKTKHVDDPITQKIWGKSHDDDKP